jgi:hypothetical protein
MVMRARPWLAYGVVAAVSMMFGLLLTAAVFLPGPICVVAGLLGVGTAVVAARGDRPSALVRTAAALSAAGLMFGWLWWVTWRMGVW